MDSPDYDKIKGEIINPISDSTDIPRVYCYFRDGYVIYDTSGRHNWWRIYDFLDILILSLMDDYHVYNLVVESNDDYLVVTIGKKFALYSADWDRSQIGLIKSDLLKNKNPNLILKDVYTFVLIQDYFYVLCSITDSYLCVLKIDYFGNLIEYQQLVDNGWGMIKHDNTVLLYSLKSMSEYTGRLYGGNRGSFFKQRVEENKKLYKYVYRFVDQNYEDEYTIPKSSIGYHSFPEQTMPHYPYQYIKTEFSDGTTGNDKQQFIWVNKIPNMHRLGLIFPKLHTNLPIVYYSDGVVYTFDIKNPVNGLYKFKIPLGGDEQT